MPLVSVLVPAYDAEATLAETLASVREQTLEDFEVIVVDDGSRDGTADVARDFAARDARFKLLEQANAGVAAARNTALAAAKGEFVAPLDADDLWHREKLERQLRRASTADSAVVCVYSWSVDIDESSRVVARRLDLDLYEGDVYAALVFTNFIGNASVPLIRAEVLRAVGGWDASLRARAAQGCEDWLLYLRLAEKGPFALERGFLVGYRQSEASMSRRVPEMTRSFALVLAEARERHPELPARLFRWSRAAFDFYRFETLYGSGAVITSLPALASGVLADPSWLTRRSIRTRGKRWLRSALGLALVDPTPPCERFREARVDAPYRISEGRILEDRRRLVAGMRIERQG